MANPAGHISVACAADDRYGAPVTAMLKSLERNLRPGMDVDVYVLDSGLRPRSRARLMASLDAARLHVNWLRVPRRIRSFPVFGHVSAATYSRLLLPDLLPAGVTRVIYLDADMIVLGDLADLWAMDAGGAPLLAAQDGDMVVSSPCGVSAYRELGLPPDAPYLNAGVLVMDVAQWRAQGIHRQAADYLHLHRHEVQFWDQDAINAVLATRWRALGREWNYAVRPQLAVPAGQEDLALREVVRSARVVHFASAIKPWDAGAVHPAKALFFEYLALTAWAGWVPPPPARRPWTREDWGRLLRCVPGADRLLRLSRAIRPRPKP